MIPLGTEIWSWGDVGLLEGCDLLVGMIAGALLSEFTRTCVRGVAPADLLQAIEPAVSCFSDDGL